MALPQIIAPPKDDKSLKDWDFFHDQDHRRIIDALNTVYYPTSFSYWPLDQVRNNRDLWEQWHQQMHFEMNQAVGYQSSNLLDFDPEDKEGFQSWIYTNYQEHRQAYATLKLASTGS